MIAERTLLVGQQQRQTAKPPIFQPQPNSALLGRLQSFLPQIEQANRNLPPAEDVDAEDRFEEPAYVYIVIK